jgi:hypothetical protein
VGLHGERDAGRLVGGRPGWGSFGEWSFWWMLSAGVVVCRGVIFGWFVDLWGLWFWGLTGWLGVVSL